MRPSRLMSIVGPAVLATAPAAQQQAAETAWLVPAPPTGNFGETVAISGDTIAVGDCARPLPVTSPHS